MPGGRPKYEITPEITEKVEAYAAQGLTQEQIARCLGISYQTLNERKKENSEFSEAIKRGQAQGVETVTNALFESAKGGNTTAQIFYLKNRDPNEWRDRKDIAHSGQLAVTYDDIVTRIMNGSGIEAGDTEGTEPTAH